MRLKKYIAEFLGTAILVLFGCGTAVFSGGLSGGTDNGTLGVVSIALAFGLSIVAGAYSIGHISGCHVNPAVSLAMFINGKLDIIDLIGYIVSQVAGAFAGSGLLMLITKETAADGLGSNGYGELSSVGISMTGAIIVEIVLTFVFVLTVLGVTSSEKYSSVAGIVIGLSAFFQGKVAASAADALAETGKGTAKYFIVIGIVETVALFTLVFGMLLLNK